MYRNSALMKEILSVEQEASFRIHGISLAEELNSFLFCYLLLYLEVLGRAFLCFGLCFWEFSLSVLNSMEELKLYFFLTKKTLNRHVTVCKWHFDIFI